MRIALFSLLLMLSVPAIAAQIYKYTDDKGNTVYTNQPPEGAAVESVELPPANTVDIRTPDLPPPLPSGPQNQEQGQPPYQTLRVGGIPDDEALRANNGSFVVTAVLQPSLQRGHTLRFLLDGIPQGLASAATALQLNNIDRGEHSLQIEVLSGERTIQRSAPERFTVQRVHTSR